MIAEVKPVLGIASLRREILGRRRFLKGCCAAATAVGALGSFGRFGALGALAQSSSDYKALVCVFLFGGNDSNNMLVPIDNEGYASYSVARGPLALARGSLLPLGSTGALGLHPSCSGMGSLFGSGKLALLANVGVIKAPMTRQDFLSNSPSIPFNLFSHLDQEQQWQTGSASSDFATGWGGRIIDAMQGQAGQFPTLVSVGGDSLFCRSSNVLPVSIAPGGPYGFVGLDGAAGGERAQVMQQLLALPSDAALVQALEGRLVDAFKYSTALGGALSSAPPIGTVFPGSYLGAQLRQIAQIIQVRQAFGVTRQVFFAIQGGFDTHAGQLPIQQALLSDLDASLSAFYTATAELGVESSVTTFTLSDFSRTLQPNDDGTDHGWGSHHLILGGAVDGGKIFGRFPELALGGPDDSTSQGRWVPTTSVDQYAATLAAWFGVPDSSMQQIAPYIENFGVRNLGFV